MKILFLNHNIISRGTYWRCFQLGKALASLGHQVTLVTAPSKVDIRAQRFEKSGVLHIVPPRLRPPTIHDGGWSPLDILWRCGWVLSQKVDAIHAFAHRPNVALPWEIRRWWTRGAALFADWDDWWTRGGIITPRRRWKFLDTLEATLLEERIPRKAEALTVASSAIRQRALNLGIRDEKILLLSQGADTECVRPLPKEDCRRQLRLPLDAPVINFTGYAVWDVQVLLKAFVHVKKAIPNALLQVVGYDKDGLMPQMVQANPHSDSVILQGAVDYAELPVYLGASDVHALPMQDRPDNRARWPMKLGDYFASGRPVVVQNVGDAAKVVEENNLGICTGLSVEEFAQGLIELLLKPQIAGTFGQAAREYAESKMQWTARAEKLLEFYEKWLGA